MSTLEVASGIAVVVVVVVVVVGVAARSIATGPGQMNVSLFGFYILTANA
jgi:hypothetical protein